MRYRFGDATVDTRTGELVRHGAPVPLEPRAFQLLRALVERPGELLDHKLLLETVWGGVSVTPHSLTEAISQLRRALGDDAQRSTIIETAHRRGYRFVAAVERVLDEGSRWRVPARLVSLIGREDALEQILSALGRARLLTLVGPGGVGKTQLALETGRRLEPNLRDGALLIDLASATAPADVHRLVADAVRLPDAHRSDHAAAIASILRDTVGLLIFDNCERVAADVGRLAERILGSAEGITVLATSQQPLAIGGEVLLRVAPLSCSTVDGGADVSPAVALFTMRAAAAQAAFDASRVKAAVRSICESFDGLPLAIE